MSDDAAAVIEAARDAGLSIATAESLTGGLVCDALVQVPGASAVMRGGVIAYATDVKHVALGVPVALLEREGPVSQSVVRAMARGVMRVTQADVAVATTGVAGPEPHGGRDVGTVMVAVVTPSGDRVTEYHFAGDRAQVRRAATEAAIAELAKALRSLSTSR